MCALCVCVCVCFVLCALCFVCVRLCRTHPIKSGGLFGHEMYLKTKKARANERTSERASERAKQHVIKGQPPISRKLSSALSGRSGNALVRQRCAFAAHHPSHGGFQPGTTAQYDCKSALGPTVTTVLRRRASCMYVCTHACEPTYCHCGI